MLLNELWVHIFRQTLPLKYFSRSVKKKKKITIHHAYLILNTTVWLSIIYYNYSFDALLFVYGYWCHGTWILRPHNDTKKNNRPTGYFAVDFIEERLVTWLYLLGTERDRYLMWKWLPVTDTFTWYLSGLPSSTNNKLLHYIF